MKLVNNEKAIIEFYRFTLNREPSAEELRIAKEGYSKKDHYRLAECMVGLMHMKPTDDEPLAIEPMGPKDKKRHEEKVIEQYERAFRAQTEVKIELAKTMNDRKAVIERMAELIALVKKQQDLQALMVKRGLLSETDLLSSREAFLQAKIRLAEFKVKDETKKSRKSQ
ncbi:MAG: hypothetical protein CMO80_06955 [Verrucomicrobiales bacterium]|nr:hypothetical protein [Verrucomicrobiales bacterium]|tara:strand:+ start:537 stop:1040 length:504 start_codon:yes stop_codon:yes gene_type:complete